MRHWADIFIGLLVGAGLALGFTALILAHPAHGEPPHKHLKPIVRLAAL